MAATLAALLQAMQSAEGAVPALGGLSAGLEAYIKTLGDGGASGAGAAPPESAEAAKARVAHDFDHAAKECTRTARALQRQHHAVARAQEVLQKCQLAAVEADTKMERLEEDMRRLWGEGADERMGGNGNAEGGG